MTTPTRNETTQNDSSTTGVTDSPRAQATGERTVRGQRAGGRTAGGRSRPRRKPKPQGQWAVDGHEALNDDEKIKAEDAGVAVAQRVRDIYALQGFDSIPADDLAPRFK